jgi:hypothetical protein
VFLCLTPQGWVGGSEEAGEGVDVG